MPPIYGWSRHFADPISLPDGRELITLRDAGHYIADLPKRQHDAAHWQTATHELLMAAERGGIVPLAEIAMRQALAHGRLKPVARVREKSTKKYRVVR